MAGHKKKKLQQAMAESAESMETPKPKSSTKVAPRGDTITTTPLVRSSLTNLAYERALKAVDRGRAKCKYTVEQLRKEFLDYVDYFSSSMVTYAKKHKHVEYAGETSGNGSSDHLEETEKVLPMTEASFSAWLGKERWWLTSQIGQLKKRECAMEGDAEMLSLLLSIQSYLTSQLLEGVLVGEFPANLVSTMVGIRQGIESETEDKAVQVPIINIVADTAKRGDSSQQTLDNIKKGIS